MLRIAAEEAPDSDQAGVYLSEEAAFYTILGLGTENPEVRAGDTLLPAGTRVVIISEDEVLLPGELGVILREVRVFFEFDGLGDSVGPEGWLRQDVLERAIPVVPHVFAGEGGALLCVEVGGYRRYRTPLVWGERAPLLARNQAGTWYRIALSDGSTGWVEANRVEVLGRPEDRAGLPVEPLPLFPPTPTDTSTPYVAPTETPQPTQPSVPPSGGGGGDGGDGGNVPGEGSDQDGGE